MCGSYDASLLRTQSRHEKRRLYAVINAIRRDGNGHDRGMKKRRLHADIRAIRRDGNGHDRGMKSVAATRRDPSAC